MGNIAIRADGLGKEYRIGQLQKTHRTLGDQLMDAMRSPLRWAGKTWRREKTEGERHETVWALKDTNFQIEHGEVVGIIGRNGAGKSTLLKILAGITEPTAGYADIYGRIGSLLEVGTGFHPELTGRENISLNGAILGMKRREIERKFDEIVAFAEIDKFIDTPVKHYSSGMYVRLAFAVAAHLEPEILLVDEVLAVGDLEFQKKCLGKMDDVAKQGRTVLFVSHNMGLMQTLCHRGIFLVGGGVAADGSITQAIDAYLGTIEQARQHGLAERTDRKGQGLARLVGVDVLSGGSREQAPSGPSDTNVATTLKSGYPATFRFWVSEFVPGMNCACFIFDYHLGQPVTTFRSKNRGSLDIRADGGLSFVCDIEELLLLPGRYRMDVAILGDSKMQDYVEGAAVFDVGDGLIRGRPAQADSRTKIAIPHRWTLPSN